MSSSARPVASRTTGSTVVEKTPQVIPESHPGRAFPPSATPANAEDDRDCRSPEHVPEGWIHGLPACYHPLVVVSPDPALRRAWIDREAARCDPSKMLRLTGTILGRELRSAHRSAGCHLLQERLFAHRWLFIDEVHLLRTASLQRLFALLLDQAGLAGVLVTVTLAQHPASDVSLTPPLVSRLLGGLIMPLSPLVASPGRPVARSTRQTTQTSAASVRPPVSARRIITATARHFGVCASDITGPSRSRSIVRARGLAILLLRQIGGCSLEAAGKALGGRDHSTILHGLNTATDRLRSDPHAARDHDLLVSRVLAFSCQVGPP
jgi:chromosomal replication initiation ATPase DnaA